jgi:tripartite-type tricarboxylate transporter receptor subunit TctC
MWLRENDMTRTDRRRFMLGGGVLTVALAAPVSAQPRWPNRPVQLICPWAAGGGTDAVLRIVANLLEKDLSQPFNVVNRTGGSGVVGHTAIAQAQPDGYTLGMITSEICMMHWQGLTEITYRNFTPFGLMNNDPAGVQVNVNSPHQTVQALAEAIKASRPGQLKASGTGQGGIWHLALAGWLVAMGQKADHVRWVPSNGAAPAMQDLAAGGLDFTTNSVVEARAMLDAGRARSLAVMSAERLGVFPNVPTLKEAMGADHQIGAWRGVAGPRGVPAEIAQALDAALDRVFRSKEYQDFLNARGFGLLFANAEGFGRHLAEADRSLGEAMRAAGLAKA